MEKIQEETNRVFSILHTPVLNIYMYILMLAF